MRQMARMQKISVCCADARRRRLPQRPDAGAECACASARRRCSREHRDRRALASLEAAAAGCRRCLCRRRRARRRSGFQPRSAGEPAACLPAASMPPGGRSSSPATREQTRPMRRSTPETLALALARVARADGPRRRRARPLHARATAIPTPGSIFKRSRARRAVDQSAAAARRDARPARIQEPAADPAGLLFGAVRAARWQAPRHGRRDRRGVEDRSSFGC